MFWFIVFALVFVAKIKAQTTNATESATTSASSTATAASSTTTTAGMTLRCYQLGERCSDSILSCCADTVCGGDSKCEPPPTTGKTIDSTTSMVLGRLNDTCANNDACMPPLVCNVLNRCATKLVEGDCINDVDCKDATLKCSIGNKRR